MKEYQIQTAIFDWINWHPELRNCSLHIPNEGKRDARYGAHLKKQGLRSGVSDIFIALARNGYHGMWVEVKSPSGKLSENQKSFIENMRKNGFYACVIKSVDEAIEEILRYLKEAGPSLHGIAQDDKRVPL